MKKFFVVLALLAFVVAGSLSMAAKKESTGGCCVKGEIKKLSAAACKKAGGKMVKDAKACKPMKKK